MNTVEDKPETEFYMTEDGSMVYAIKQDGWDQGNPHIVNEVWIRINAPSEHCQEIVDIIINGLNNYYKTNQQIKSK